jgi:hypothetical protein
MPLKITLTSGRQGHATLEFIREVGVNEMVVATYVGMYRSLDIQLENGQGFTTVPVMHGQGVLTSYLDEFQAGGFTNGVFMDDTNPNAHVVFLDRIRTYLPVTHHPYNNYEEQYTDDTSDDEGPDDQSDGQESGQESSEDEA